MNIEDKVDLRAKELVNRFYETMVYKDMALTGKRAAYNQAKSLAYIAADEIINEVIDIHNKILWDIIGRLEDYITYQFWKQVREKIKTL